MFLKIIVCLLITYRFELAESKAWPQSVYPYYGGEFEFYFWKEKPKILKEFWNSSKTKNSFSFNAIAFYLNG